MTRLDLKGGHIDIFQKQKKQQLARRDEKLNRTKKTILTHKDRSSNDCMHIRIVCHVKVLQKNSSYEVDLYFNAATYCMYP